jgi:Zn-finger nucleic acid-binding protein
MNCPKCKNSPLAKADYSHSPFICKSCGGVWSRQLCDLPEIPSTETEDNSEVPTDFDEKTGLCPEGHGIMLRAKVDLEKPFYLERCTKCGGIWFDKGEIRRLAESQISLHLSEFWSRAWQTKQRKLNSRNNYLKLNKKLLGESIFNEISGLVEKLKNHPEKGRAIAFIQNEVENNQ